MSPRSPLLFFLLPSRCLTRRWTGGCAGVSIDPKWQVASEFVAWRQWLGRLDREGQLNLRQTRDKPNPVPTNHDWGEVSACSVLWNDLFMRKCSSQHLTCMKCAFNWQRAGKRHSTDRRDKNWEEVSNPGICWNEILCMCLKPTDPLESQEILPSQSTVNTPLLCQKQNKKGKQHVCCLSEKFLYPYSNAFQLICSCKSLCQIDNINTDCISQNNISLRTSLINVHPNKIKLGLNTPSSALVFQGQHATWSIAWVFGKLPKAAGKCFITNNTLREIHILIVFL